MTKHTPGPWHWEKRRTLQHLRSTENTIAQISAPLPATAECGANATLIAAAPELLAALKLATGYVERTHGVIAAAAGHNNLILPDLSICHAAIAKAEGQS